LKTPPNLSRAVLLIVALVPLRLVAPVALAQVPAAFELPWTDVAPAVADGHARAAAVGVPDPRIGRFDAARASARTDGRARAVAALHAFADDALARVRATPQEATRVHGAIDREAAVSGVRPLVDAGAVVVVRVPVAVLRAACAREGLPWSG
jgi:hypothetical protein